MTLRNGRGGIVFDGNGMPPLKRRFWVLEKAGTMKFTLDPYYLKPESSLTKFGFPFDRLLNKDQVFIR